MWISLWNPCARIVRISHFHAQDSGWPIRRVACPTPASWRSFGRSVRVPLKTGATPRRPTRVLRPPADSGGETVGARGTQVPRRQIEQPEPGARDSQGFLKPCPPGAARRWDRQGDAPDGMGRLCTEAGASGPTGLRSPRTEMAGAAGRTREGASAPEAGSLREASSRRPEKRGSPRSAKRVGRRRTADSGERPAL